MLALETVVDTIKDQVRFKQTVNPDVPTLTTDLTTPTSARLVDHALLTNENLNAIAPDFKNWNYPDWTDINYAVGERRRFNQNIYECNTAIVAPAANPENNASWTLIAGLSGYLEDKRTEAARNVINSVYNEKKNERYTKENLDHMLVYTGPGRMDQLIVKQGRAVGFELRVLDSLAIKILIETIGLQLSDQQTAGNELTLYLYHSSQVAPLALIDIDYTKQGSVQWFDQTTDNILEYESFTTDEEIAGGTYFLMYYEDDLIGQALNYQYSFDGGVGCSSCNKYNLNAYRKWSQYVAIRPVSVASGNLDPGRNLFPIESVVFNERTTWGLNLRVTSQCDLTDYFVRHPELFADAINRQLTVDLLRELSNTTRNNILSETVTDKARFALQSKELGGEGELEKLNSALDALGFELSNLQNSNCLPRINTKGAYMNSIGPQNNYINNNNGYSGFKEPRQFRR